MRILGKLVSGLFMHKGGDVRMKAALSAKLIKADGRVEDLGIIARKVVTDVFVAALVDELHNNPPTNFNAYKYHDSGTGVVAENATDTALGTPTGVARATGTQTEGATANIYKTVATITYDGSYAVTEHGVFDAATTGGLMDRSVFSAINVGNGDSIEFTYQLTCTSGG